MHARPIRFLLVFTVLATALGACAPAGEEESTTSPAPSQESAATSYADDIAAWHEGRVERLRRPGGWLSLVGLSWLEEGDNAVGSADGAVVLPASVAARVGTIVLAGEQASFVADEGGGVTHDGQPVTELALRDDTAEDGPTVLEAGTVSFYVIRRGERFGVRVKDSASPVLAAFEGIETYPVDETWRIEGRFERFETPQTLGVPNVLGVTEETPSPGAVVFEVDGRTHSIQAMEGSGENNFFLVFGDKTNGKETYGGGRFLYVDALYSDGEGDGRVVVDFNKAYNPPCVFTPYATCPLPPPENRLDLEIRAGEKKYGDGAH